MTARARVAAQWSRIALFFFFASLAIADTSLAQIVGSAQLAVERRAHSATLLDGGTVLIVGGDNQNGMVGQAEVFDPVAQTSSLAASLANARTDHSATKLVDGRVLVIGGRDQHGALASTEIYEPLRATFRAGPFMMTPRSGHTATVLGDGKLLVVGGDANGSAELYDPVTQKFSLVTGTLITARRLHSAVRANTGQVLIVGGVNAQNAALNTAEVYDPVSDSFYLPPTDLRTLRSLATLKLLPDGKVQVIGGDVDFSMEIFDPELGWFNALALLPPTVDSLDATLSTQSRAALISPTISQHQLLQGSLTHDQLALLDRANHSSTELPAQNQALIAGGLSSAGQFLNSATLVSSSSASVTTDKTDYAPGSVVTITGKGFHPNETVNISLHEAPEGYPDPALVVTADDQGNFVSMQFAPQTIDIGRTFTLTAQGGTSGFTAQTAFTDGEKVGSVTVGAQSPDPVTPGSDATYTITVVRGPISPSSGNFTVDLSVTTALPAGAAVVSFSPNPVLLTPTDVSTTSTLTISTATSTPAGTTSFTVLAETSNMDFATNSGSLVVAGSNTGPPGPVPPGPAPTGNSVPTATGVTITGTPAVTQVLTGTYTYGDAEGDAEGTSTFRWLRDDVAISGATAVTYTVVQADLAHTLTFEVTPVAATGASPGAAVVSAGVVILNSWPTATGVTITGTPAVTQVLTGNYTYGDADGDAEGTSTFRWRRDGVAIGGATAITYTVVQADLTHTITFEVTPVAATGASIGAPVVSAGVVIQNAVPTATGVTITGTLRVRHVLTGNYTYGDREGDAEGASTFRWLRDGVAIDGATAITYTVVLADLRYTITFEVTPVAATGASPGAAVVSAGVQWHPPQWPPPPR